MSKYYDWNKTLSYDADVTMVVGARGIGKTYGLRLQFIRDYLKNGVRFVELVRYKNQLSAFIANYFQRIEERDEFPGYIFKTSQNVAYIAPRTDKKKPDWCEIGYFAALTDAIAMKSRTFSRVRRIALDEAIIDHRIDRYHGYLRHEFATLTNIVDTVSRERADSDKNERPRIYLMGNACDLMNPYFERYGVDYEPRKGYSWYCGKTFLLHYAQDKQYGDDKRLHTVAGRMLDGIADGDVANANDFIRIDYDSIEEKPKRARYEFAFIFDGDTYAIWQDSGEGVYYVTDYVPKHAKNIYALTSHDHKLNRVLVRRTTPLVSGFAELYRYGCVRFTKPYLKAKFFDVLTLIGVQ